MLEVHTYNVTSHLNTETVGALPVQSHTRLLKHISAGLSVLLLIFQTLTAHLGLSLQTS